MKFRWLFLRSAELPIAAIHTASSLALCTGCGSSSVSLEDEVPAVESKTLRWETLLLSEAQKTPLPVAIQQEPDHNSLTDPRTNGAPTDETKGAHMRASWFFRPDPNGMIQSTDGAACFVKSERRPKSGRPGLERRLANAGLSTSHTPPHCSPSRECRCDPFAADVSNSVWWSRRSAYAAWAGTGFPTGVPPHY